MGSNHLIIFDLLGLAASDDEGIDAAPAAAAEAGPVAVPDVPAFRGRGGRGLPDGAIRGRSGARGGRGRRGRGGGIVGGAVGVEPAPGDGVVGGGARGAAVNRGRGRGWHHDRIARARLSAGQTRRFAQRVSARLQGRGFSQRVVEAAFGAPPDCADKSARSTPVHLHGLALAIDQHHGNASDVARGAVSHTRAQASQIADFMMKPNTNAIIASNVFDDADMWVKRASRKHQSQPDRLDDKLSKRGRVEHKPVMKVCEVIYRLGPSGPGAFQATDVVTLAVALPQANWASIHNSWRSWSIINGGGPGCHVDVDGKLKEALRTVAGGDCDKTLIYTKDSLEANLVIEASLAQASIASQASPDPWDLLGHNCLAHGAVLGMKLSLNRIGDVATTFVRTGHLFQSSKCFGEFDTHLKAMADKSKYWWVLELPPDFERWQHENAGIFEVTMPAFGMGDAAVTFARTMGNGDPRDPVSTHWCV